MEATTERCECEVCAAEYRPDLAKVDSRTAFLILIEETASQTSARLGAAWTE